LSDICFSVCLCNPQNIPKEILGVESCDVGILVMENFAKYFSEKYGGLIFGEQRGGGGGGFF